MVDYWIENGKKFIYPQRYDSWCNHIYGTYDDKYFSTY